MAAKPKPITQAILLPIPLTPAQRALKLAFLTANLAQYSLDQIAEQELNKIYAWPLMKSSALKRLYKNYTLVYTRAELKNLLLLSYYQLLGTSVPPVPPTANPPSPPPIPATPVDGTPNPPVPPPIPATNDPAPEFDPGWDPGFGDGVENVGDAARDAINDVLDAAERIAWAGTLIEQFDREGRTFLFEELVNGKYDKEIFDEDDGDGDPFEDEEGSS